MLILAVAVIAFLGSIALLAIVLVFLVDALADQDLFLARVETGGFKFVVKGETLDNVLDMSISPAPPDQSWLERNWGIFFYGLWPLKKIHRFDVIADKLQEVSRDRPIRERIQTEIRRGVDYLRYRFPHPVLIKDVELGSDRWKIDVILMLDIRVTNPVTVVFSYKGKVLEQVDAAVSSAVIDYCNREELGYSELLNTSKGTDSELAQKIIALNNDTTDPTRNPDPDGLRDRFGVEILAVMIEAVDLSPEQKALDEAAKLIHQRRLEADAKEEEARGQAAFEAKQREGIGKGLRAIADELKASGLRREEAAKIIFEQVRTGNLAGPDSKLTTYVEGGGNVLPTLPVKKEGE